MANEKRKFLDRSAQRPKSEVFILFISGKITLYRFMNEVHNNKEDFTEENRTKQPYKIPRYYKNREGYDKNP